ncbi:MAG: isochorismate synthase [Acidobacteria bacterium]|nr:isochorismate synthase [Acidobacteriota bacterium]
MFQRRRIAPLPASSLRSLGARAGWLLDAPDTLRVGFGGVAVTLDLPHGVADSEGARRQLGQLTLTGDEGPSGSGIVAMGSLPFNRDAPSHLDVPRFVVTQSAEGTWITSADDQDWRALVEDEAIAVQEPQMTSSVTYRPSPEEYAHHVANAVEVLRRKEIDKVVLARAIVGTVEHAIDCGAVAQRLRVREPSCTVYGLPTTDDRRYVGASPELLVRRRGDDVTCHPLAGTIAIPADVDPVDYHSWLLGSAKNLHEHGVLVDDLVTALSRYYDDIDADPTPSIVTLRTVAHLGTWIRGRHATPPHAPDALALLDVLHPTAAVGGIPRVAAYELLQRLEPFDRGHYAGPVGWTDENGDGEFWIGIRGVLVDGADFEAWAGAGIVSESDPIAEREETRDKLASVLSSVLLDRI